MMRYTWIIITILMCCSIMQAQMTEENYVTAAGKKPVPGLGEGTNGWAQVNIFTLSGGALYSNQNKHSQLNLVNADLLDISLGNKRLGAGIKLLETMTLDHSEDITSWLPVYACFPLYIGESSSLRDDAQNSKTEVIQTGVIASIGGSAWCKKPYLHSRLRMNFFSFPVFPYGFDRYGRVNYGSYSPLSFLTFSLFADAAVCPTTKAYRIADDGSRSSHGMLYQCSLSIGISEGRLSPRKIPLDF